MNEPRIERADAEYRGDATSWSVALEPAGFSLGRALLFGKRRFSI